MKTPLLISIRGMQVARTTSKGWFVPMALAVGAAGFYSPCLVSFVRRAPTHSGADAPIHVAKMTVPHVLWWHSHVQPIIDRDASRTEARFAPLTESLCQRPPQLLPTQPPSTARSTPKTSRRCRSGLPKTYQHFHPTSSSRFFEISLPEMAQPPSVKSSRSTPSEPRCRPWNRAPR